MTLEQIQALPNNFYSGRYETQPGMYLVFTDDAQIETVFVPIGDIEEIWFDKEDDVWYVRTIDIPKGQASYAICGIHDIVHIL